jgi:hypothetical protein
MKAGEEANTHVFPLFIHFTFHSSFRRASGGHPAGIRWASGGHPVGIRWASGGPIIDDRIIHLIHLISLHHRIDTTISCILTCEYSHSRIDHLK